ncbi:Hypothetical Protein RRSL_01204 [Ralstonia solanacearum UW551]|uniref:HNH endonuclease n=2 Tax=Ralstonia solanacearum TaxID=305 RepID=A0ABF7R8S3_RALSL|nr:hypothetical protein CCY86_00255 [Ralstonia solanacearum]EAP71526.1 Hypothetical Protein RRSL_01204 [Ralstonia solanacearum UW551]CEJ17874.1 conserved hypothetical protein [Ralstonia solanacearum IPO1609]ATJ84835.1 hypothetical protein CDC59_00255 [Ralstonia solanacearum]KFX81604.1 hypothetical protein KR99_22135 [Ralstonia solanacearum]
MNQIRRRCAACGTLFLPRPQTPGQRYCSAAECQRQRRRRWQQQHLRSDDDYRDNQARSRAAWSQCHSDYWRRYREAHPAYTARNRDLQRARNLRRRTIAKMYASAPKTPLPSGTYMLQHASDDGVAKMDVWRVQIVMLPPVRAPSRADCKEMM